MRLPVVTAAAGADWEARLIAADGLAAHGVTVSRRCVDIVELLAVAAAGHGRAALIDAGLRGLDADAIDRIKAAGVAPVAVVAGGEVGPPSTVRAESTMRAEPTMRAESTMRGLGFVHVVAADAAPAVIATVVARAVSESAPAGCQPSSRAFSDPLMSMPIPSAAELDRAFTQTAGVGRGSVVAVWGPTGAPGRTTVALALADEIARLDASALLLDADVYGGSLPTMLGLLDESPGLAAACRLAGTNRLDVDALAQLCWQLRPALRVLTGIAIARRWPEVRATALSSVLATARSLADFTVIDCGFGLETDEELSFDSLAPRRNGATLAILDAADLVIVVGAADPVGIQRLVRGVAELREAEVPGPQWVVVNKVRRAVVPGEPATELARALDRFAGVAPVALLPYDLDSLDLAVGTGRLLADARGSSPLRKAVAELAVAIVGVRPTARHRRRARAHHT